MAGCILISLERPILGLGTLFSVSFLVRAHGDHEHNYEQSHYTGGGSSQTHTCPPVVAHVSAL